MDLSDLRMTYYSTESCTKTLRLTDFLIVVLKNTFRSKKPGKRLQLSMTRTRSCQRTIELGPHKTLKVKIFPL